MIYILDIETKPNQSLIGNYTSNIKAPSNYKDEEKIKQYIAEKQIEYLKNMSVDQDYSEIFCIGLKELDQKPFIGTYGDIVSILKSGATLVTFNGKNFDLPIIIKNGIRMGISLPYRQLFEMTKRFRCNDHIDLMETLSFNNQAKPLNTYCQLYLGVQKKDINFGLASDDEIREHCLEDLELTEKLFNKFSELF